VLSGLLSLPIDLGLRIGCGSTGRRGIRGAPADDGVLLRKAGTIDELGVRGVVVMNVEIQCAERMQEVPGAVLGLETDEVRAERAGQHLAAPRELAEQLRGGEGD